jgi:hypothetical protein
VEFASCEVGDDSARSTELHAFFSLLEQGVANAPRRPQFIERFPLCRNDLTMVT